MNFKKKLLKIKSYITSSPKLLWGLILLVVIIALISAATAFDNMFSNTSE